jgi:hypothetical protein
MLDGQPRNERGSREGFFSSLSRFMGPKLRIIRKKILEVHLFTVCHHLTGLVPHW